MTHQKLSELDQDPSLEGRTQKFALASVAALFIHFSGHQSPSQILAK